MKNILFAHFGGDKVRGSEVCLLNLLSGIDRNKINPVAVCNSGVMRKELSELGVKTHLIDIPEIMLDGDYRKFQVYRYLRALTVLYGIARNEGSHLIYSNSGLPTQLGYPVSRLRNIPILCHIHTPHPKRYAWIWLFKFADKVIFVSNQAKDELVGKVAFSGGVRVVYNGIDVDRRFRKRGGTDSNLRGSMGIGRDEVVIGQVGSLVGCKGVDILIRAFGILEKKLANVRLLVIGEGREKESLLRLSKELNLSGKVIFLGEVRNPEDYYINVMDVNVMASRFEGLPLSLVEASSCGLPSVASDCGGMPEVVEDGVTGYLFEQENDEMLAEKLLLLARDGELRRRMGEKGRERAEKLFGMEAFVRNIEREIMEML